jgi:hypothetical protein
MIMRFIFGIGALLMALDTILKDGVFMRGAGHTPSRRVPRSESPILFFLAIAIYVALGVALLSGKLMGHQ